MEQKDAVNLLYSNAGMGLFITFISSSVLVFTFPHSEPNRLLQLAWWTTINAVVLLRLIDLAYFFSRTRHKDGQTIKSAFRRFAMGASTSGGLWGSYAAAIVHTDNWAEIAITCIIISWCICTYSTGTTTASTGSRRGGGPLLVRRVRRTNAGARRGAGRAVHVHGVRGGERDLS